MNRHAMDWERIKDVDQLCLTIYFDAGKPEALSHRMNPIPYSLKMPARTFPREDNGGATRIIVPSIIPGKFTNSPLRQFSVPVLS